MYVNFSYQEGGFFFFLSFCLEGLGLTSFVSVICRTVKQHTLWGGQRAGARGFLSHPLPADPHSMLLGDMKRWRPHAHAGLPASVFDHPCSQKCYLYLSFLRN